MSTWPPEHGDIIIHEGDLYLVEMLDQTGKPSQLPPRWYVVAAPNNTPDWSTVTYHRWFSEALRRLGHQRAPPTPPRPGEAVMNLARAKTFGELLYASRPPLKDPAYTLWMQTVSAFVRFVEEANSSIDPAALERLCMTGHAGNDSET